MTQIGIVIDVIHSDSASIKVIDGSQTSDHRKKKKTTILRQATFCTAVRSMLIS